MDGLSGYSFSAHLSGNTTVQPDVRPCPLSVNVLGDVPRVGDDLAVRKLDKWNWTKAESHYRRRRSAASPLYGSTLTDGALDAELGCHSPQLGEGEVLDLMFHPLMEKSETALPGVGRDGGRVGTLVSRDQVVEDDLVLGAAHRGPESACWRRHPREEELRISTESSGRPHLSPLAPPLRRSAETHAWPSQEQLQSSAGLKQDSLGTVC